MTQASNAAPQAFLVAVKQRREQVRVYAVLASDADAAVELVTESAADDVEVEIAGQLSKRMARSLKLQPGEIRFI
ncbi:hypothetical protein HCU64_23270 [Methylobacterium sp. C25]|uniref:hypothetical protein n=1 Tax=Methylobacterium sp. C25 TaxID=2721622 RepID=UPI001F434E1C|nr:hypothetical protein [Methylobacterium sp. C25]MCE4226667.1 hypothetical protein [Methylobacterium sp. C25]